MPPTNVRRDLVRPRPHSTPRTNLKLLVKFTVQPDDGQCIGPKHVVVYPMYYSACICIVVF